MAIRITCPFCKTSNTFSDDKRGKKSACTGCEKLLSIPAGSSKQTSLAKQTAVQEQRRTKVKVGAAPARGSDDDDDNENEVRRPSAKSKKRKKAKKGLPLGLLLGGAGAGLLVLLLGAGGVLALVFWPKKPPVETPIAKVQDKKNKEPTSAVNHEERKPIVEKKAPIPDSIKPLPDPTPPPRSTPTDPGLDRKPANLTINLTAVTQRTVKLIGTDTTTAISQGKVKELIIANSEADILEVLGSDPQGALIKTGIGPNTKLGTQTNGRTSDATKDCLKLLRAVPPKFVMDNTGNLQSRVSGPAGKASQDLQSEYKARFAQICNSLEAAMVPMPNRTVQPLQTFTAKVPFAISSSAPGQSAKVADLEMTCTYKGTRTRNQREEAVITVAGQLKGRDSDSSKVSGDVSGKIGFDIAGGFISLAQLKISWAPERTDSDLQVSYACDIDLDRQKGNPLNIQLPTEKKADPPPPPPTPTPKNTPAPEVKSKPFFQQTLTLTQVDPPDPTQGKKKTHMKVIGFNLKAGKTYTISATSTAFDPFIRLETTALIPVAQSAGGAKNNRTITYRPPVTGTYRVVVATHNYLKIGQFQLTITEAP